MSHCQCFGLIAHRYPGAALTRSVLMFRRGAMTRRVFSLVVMSLICVASARAETPFDAFAKLMESAGDSLTKMGAPQPPRRAGSGPTGGLPNVPMPHPRPGEGALAGLPAPDPTPPATTTAFVEVPVAAAPL